MLSTAPCQHSRPCVCAFESAGFIRRDLCRIALDSSLGVYRSVGPVLLCSLGHRRHEILRVPLRVPPNRG